MNREVRVRIDVKRVIGINLVEHTFKAHFKLEASWLEPDMVGIDLDKHPWDSDADTVKLQQVGHLVLKDCTEGGVQRNFFAPRLSVRNQVETCSEMMWYTIYENKDNMAAGPVVCLRWEVVGTFQELYELRLFPMDAQDLHLDLLTGRENVSLVRNNSGLYRSMCNVTNFTLASEYVLSDRVQFNETMTNAEESAAHLQYSLLSMAVHVDRKSSYWMLNVVLPMAIITGCAFASFVVPQADIADRCSITLTMLLAQVAYKYLIGEKLPNLGYATLIDMYVLFCFIVTFAVVITQCYFASNLAAALGSDDEPTWQWNISRRDPLNPKAPPAYVLVHVPATPVILILVWIGLHLLIPAIVGAVHLYKQRFNPFWSKYATLYAKRALWIGPLDNAGNDWAIRKLVEEFLVDSLHQRVQEAGGACSEKQWPHPKRVLFWKPTAAVETMRNSGIAPPYKLQNSFAVAVYDSKATADYVREAFKRAKDLKLLDHDNGGKLTLVNDSVPCFNVAAIPAEEMNETSMTSQSCMTRRRMFRIEPLDSEWAPLTTRPVAKRGKVLSGSGSGAKNENQGPPLISGAPMTARVAPTTAVAH